MKWSTVLSTLLVLSASQPADALVAEIWARTSFQFTNLGRAEASATATGLATLTTSSASSDHLSSLTLGFMPGLSLNTQIPSAAPLSFPLTGVVFSSIRARPDLQGGVIGNVSGAIASSAGGLAPNTLPLTGGIRICLFQHALPPCSIIGLSYPVGEASAGMQVGMGVGGILTIGGMGTIRLSIVGAPYTVKTVSAVNRTTNGAFDVFVEQGFAHGPASLTSSTAQTSGVLQIVTASHVTFEAPVNNDRSGHISRTLIHVVPEPDLLLLFGGGAAGLALLGRKRGRR